MKQGTWIGLAVALALTGLVVLAVVRRGADDAARAAPPGAPIPPPPGPTISPAEWMHRIEQIGERRDSEALAVLGEAAKSAPGPACRAALDRLAPADSKPSADLLVLLAKSLAPEALPVLVQAISDHGTPPSRRALEEVLRRRPPAPLPDAVGRAASLIEMREAAKRRTRPAGD